MLFLSYYDEVAFKWHLRPLIVLVFLGGLSYSLFAAAAEGMAKAYL